jgi:hypothetical protein
MGMHRVVYKYTADLKGHINFPPHSKLLDVRPQNDKLCAWALVDPDHMDVVNVKMPDVLILGTGWEIPLEIIDRYDHFKTIHTGGFVWHIFKKGTC